MRRELPTTDTLEKAMARPAIKIAKTARLPASGSLGKDSEGEFTIVKNNAGKIRIIKTAGTCASFWRITLNYP